jgi:hypothetical protein
MISKLMTWLKLSAGVLGGVLGAFGEELGFAAGFCDITTVGEGYAKVRCGCGGVDSIGPAVFGYYGANINDSQR